jgi:uncharacterized membrane protein YphA (DoxX/SURF4 family)
MRDNPIHTFLQFLTGQVPDQIHLGGLGWVTILLYWVMLVSGVSIAVVNWHRDPQQRTANHLSICAMRFLMAGMWYLGTLWKLPWPVSDGFKFWLDNTVKYSSWQFHADIMQVFVDHIAIAQPLVYLLEVFFTASLMLGFMVRLSGILGALFILNLLIGLYNDPTEWPWTYVGLICAQGMFAATQAGRSLGLDNLVAKRLVLALGDDGALARAYRLAS